MDPAVIWLVSLSAAIIFIASAAMKLRDLAMFEGAVDNYRILPELLVKPFAYAIPIIELLAAIAIAATPSRRIGAAVLLALLAAFTLAIVVNLARGRYDVDCGCFGPALKQTLSWWLIARNAALAVVLALALAPESSRSLGLLDGFTIAIGAATLIILYASINYVFANMPGLRELRARYA